MLGGLFLSLTSPALMLQSVVFFREQCWLKANVVHFRQTEVNLFSQFLQEIIVVSGLYKLV